MKLPYKHLSVLIRIRAASVAADTFDGLDRTRHFRAVKLAPRDKHEISGLGQKFLLLLADIPNRRSRYAVPHQTAISMVVALTFTRGRKMSLHQRGGFYSGRFVGDSELEFEPRLVFFRQQEFFTLNTLAIKNPFIEKKRIAPKPPSNN
jgi:hypothetical protein